MAELTIMRSAGNALERSEIELLHHEAPGKLARLFNWVSENPEAHLRNAASATLRKDDFEQILEQVKEIQELDLVGMNDLIAAGLTIDTDIMSTVILDEYVGDIGPARRDLNPTAYQDNQTQFGASLTPNPITHLSYSVPFRQNGFAYKQRVGNNRAVRNVMESLEELLFDGDSTIRITTGDGNAICYGYTSHPNRATVTISNWYSATTNVLANCRALVQAQIDDNGFMPKAGSCVLYVPSTIKKILDADAFSAKGDRSFTEQILKQNPEISKVQATENLTGSGSSCEVVLQHMRPESIELAVAQQPTVLPHIKSFELEPSKYTCYACMVPIIKSDANSATGTVHGATA